MKQPRQEMLVGQHMNSARSSPNAKRQKTPLPSAQVYNDITTDFNAPDSEGAEFNANLGTPAFESSLLSSFRFRQRKPSILQMMELDDPPSLEDDSKFLGSLSSEDEPSVPGRTRNPVSNSVPQSDNDTLGKRLSKDSPPLVSSLSGDDVDSNSGIGDESFPNDTSQDPPGSSGLDKALGSGLSGVLSTAGKEPTSSRSGNITHKDNAANFVGTRRTRAEREILDKIPTLSLRQYLLPHRVSSRIQGRLHHPKIQESNGDTTKEQSEYEHIPEYSVTEEIKQLSGKFYEVSKWSMEFEDV